MVHIVSSLVDKNIIPDLSKKSRIFGGTANLTGFTSWEYVDYYWRTKTSNIIGNADHTDTDSNNSENLTISGLSDGQFTNTQVLKISGDDITTIIMAPGIIATSS